MKGIEGEGELSYHHNAVRQIRHVASGTEKQEESRSSTDQNHGEDPGVYGGTVD